MKPTQPTHSEQQAIDDHLDAIANEDTGGLSHRVEGHRGGSLESATDEPREDRDSPSDSGYVGPNKNGTEQDSPADPAAGQCAGREVPE